LICNPLRQAATGPQRWFSCALAGSLLALAPLSGLNPAFAQKPAPSEAARAAFETLTRGASTSKPATLAQAPAVKPVASAPAAAPMPAPGMTAGTLVVQRGQTLDMIIRRHLPDSPYKIEIVRRAIIEMNPAVFPARTPHLMRAGAQMVLPTPEQIRQSVLASNPAMKPYLMADEEQAGTRASRQRDQSRWVRFP
jgi:Tfp pilus assembly protein FimV